MRELRMKKQKGAALVIALVILLGVTIVSVASLTSGTLELMMAGNEEARMTSFHRAQAGVDATAARIENFIVFGDIGYQNCTTEYESLYSVSCNVNNIVYPQGYTPTHTAVLVQRESPLTRCPPRGMATSCENYSVATFSMESRHDATGSRGGHTELNEGFLVLVPALEQSSQN